MNMIYFFVSAICSKGRIYVIVVIRVLCRLVPLSATRGGLGGGRYWAAIFGGFQPIYDVTGTSHLDYSRYASWRSGNEGFPN
jgi:hypothetical protein